MPGSRAYNEAMLRVATIAARVALIQHDNLLDVQNFFERDRIRIMMMEWVDGYDLRQLLAPALSRPACTDGSAVDVGGTSTK